MKVAETVLPDVLQIEPAVHGDERGHFFEFFQQERYAEFGIAGPWTQDNISRSEKGVLRGLHFQLPRPQGKLISALTGCIFDVAIDLRRSSPTFGKWVGVELSSDKRNQLWVPPGFAHGFLVLSDSADVLYKCSGNYWSAGDEHSIRYDDPDIGIEWPGDIRTVNDRDLHAPFLKALDVVFP